MFDKFSERVTDSLVHNQIINIEDRDIYCYGVQQGLVAVLNFATTLLIGCLYGMPWESIIYMICYIPLRHYAGGFHAKTPARCYVFSTFMLFSVLSAMRWIGLGTFVCGLSVIASFIFISAFSPVADQNKPLDNKERQVYHIRAMVIAGTESTMTFICILLDATYLATCISWCLIVSIVMLGIGLAKNQSLTKRINQKGMNL